MTQFLAEIKKVQAIKTASLDVETRVEFVTNERQVLDLGKLPSDTIVRVIVEDSEAEHRCENYQDSREKDLFTDFSQGTPPLSPSARTAESEARIENSSSVIDGEGERE